MNNKKQFILEIYSNKNKKNWVNKWNLRAKYIAKIINLIFNKYFILVDIGCGEMKIKQYLKELNCNFKYIPCDIISRDNETIIIDINTNINSLPHGDIAIMLGVAEYIDNINLTLPIIIKKYKYIIFTHRRNYKNIKVDILNKFKFSDIVDICHKLNVSLIYYRPDNTSYDIYIIRNLLI